MARNSKKTTKKPAKNAKAKSTDDAKLHERIIQDRIAGKRVTELAKKYKLHRNAISDILKKNEARIEQEINALLAERQERINKAFEDDRENMAELITASGKLMKTAVAKLQKKINDGDVKDSTLISAINTTIQAWDRIRSTTLSQQKEASK